METRRNNNRRLDLLLLLIISFSATLLTSPAALSPAALYPAAFSAGEKVKLSLYYESLCPNSEEFIIDHLNDLFVNGLISIVDLKISPFGNAEILPNGTIVCQHGEWECLINTVEACAIHAWPVADDHFPFIHCVENLSRDGNYAQWQTCFEKLNLDPKPVLYCYQSGLGDKLERQYAAEIEALKPPHTYVPWVVVDGEPLFEDYFNYTRYICKAYKGSNMPQVCRNLSQAIITSKHSANRVNSVCFKEEKRKINSI